MVSPVAAAAPPADEQHESGQDASRAAVLTPL